jgi:hypothetical protein
MDVESLLRRSRETPKKMMKNFDTESNRNMKEKYITESSGPVDPQKEQISNTSSFHVQSETHVPKNSKEIVEQHIIDMDDGPNHIQEARSEVFEKRDNTMDDPFGNHSGNVTQNRPSAQYLRSTHALEMSDTKLNSNRNHKSDRAYYKKPQKHVSISMSDKPGNFLKKYRNKGK